MDPQPKWFQCPGCFCQCQFVNQWCLWERHSHCATTSGLSRPSDSTPGHRRWPRNIGSQMAPFPWRFKWYATVISAVPEPLKTPSPGLGEEGSFPQVAFTERITGIDLRSSGKFLIPSITIQVAEHHILHELVDILHYNYQSNGRCSGQKTCIRSSFCF